MMAWGPDRLAPSRFPQSRQAIEVAACIVRRADGRVLLAERTSGQISPGFWEAPGGKVDPGETLLGAALRELDEEVGLRAEAPRPWIAYEHAFPLRRIHISFFLVEHWSGEARGREGQRLAWVDPAAPDVGPILASNRRALQSVSPPSMVVTASPGAAGDVGATLDQLRQACGAGARLICLSAPGMSPDQRVAFARRANQIAAPFAARVLIDGSEIEARRAGLAGVHSPGEALDRMRARPAAALWAVSCRHEPDARRAVALGADLLAVSPRRDCGALDLDVLRRTSAAAPVPVYAGSFRGDESVDDAPAITVSVAAARAVGAAGVAAPLGASGFAGEPSLFSSLGA